MLIRSLASPLLINMDERSLHEQHRVHQMRDHILFCPKKRRRKVLLGPVQERLKQMIEPIAHGQQCQMVRLAIQPAPFCISAFDRL